MKSKVNKRRLTLSTAHEDSCLEPVDTGVLEILSFVFGSKSLCLCMKPTLPRHWGPHQEHVLGRSGSTPQTWQLFPFVPARQEHRLRREDRSGLGWKGREIKREADEVPPWGRAGGRRPFCPVLGWSAGHSSLRPAPEPESRDPGARSSPEPTAR